MVTVVGGKLELAEFYQRLDTLVPGDAAPGQMAPFGHIGIRCERLTIDALEEIHAYSTDERLYEFLEFSPFVTLDDTRAYLRKLLDRMGGPPLGRSAMYWVLRRKADGYLVGTMSLVSIDYQRQSAEWGYGVDPKLWGRGYVLELQEMLKHFAFEVLSLNRLQGMTISENERTIASVIAAGMKHEGTLRQFYCKAGVFHDAWMYGMLRSDHFAAKPMTASPRTTYSAADVIRIVGAVLTEESLTENSGMHDVYSWDSLTHMSIMVAVSDRTGISLSPSDMVRATSVKAIVALLAERG